MKISKAYATADATVDATADATVDTSVWPDILNRPVIPV